MKRQILCVAAVVLVASVASVQADTSTWDAYAGFNSSSNAASDLWQYLSAPQGTNSGYTLLPSYAAFPYLSSINGWQNSGNFPAIGKDTAAGEIKIHPEDTPATNNAAVIGWKSPSAMVDGLVNVTFSLVDRDPGVSADGMTYNLFKTGDATALATGILPDGGNTGLISVPNVAVSKDTMLYLQVGPGSTNHWYDLGGVTFTVTGTAVPEPSSILMLTFGLFGLLAYAWRKRK